MTLALFDAHPALAAAFPRLPIGEFPTPLLPLPAMGAALQVGELAIKRDDVTAPLFGGNKIRKLEFLLAAAQRRGAQRVLTLGFAGSNHALATAICAQGAGLSAISILLPQANAAYVRRNLLAGHAFGAELHHCPSVPAAVATVIATMLRDLLQRGRTASYIPPGGSSPLGCLGYVSAAFELRRQLETQGLGPPGRIYLALGSMGTAAGLAVGLKAAGLPSRVVAVRVVDRRYASPDKLLALCARVAGMLRAADRTFPEVAVCADDVEVRDEFFGDGYGVFTAAARAAATRLREATGVALDGTYSAKALAALFADAASGSLREMPVLFWNTCNSRDLDARIAGIDHRTLPPGFQRYFDSAAQDWP
jgi:1-aminocyclopropane-1-carboxylate deaminase/D-cysteine desulfhydrase-like pyridoxal-dependent ACC family enzyme